MTLIAAIKMLLLTV